MKKYLFLVMVCTGATFTQSGYGYNADQALMDAAEKMSYSGEFPEDDIVAIDLIDEEG